AEDGIRDRNVTGVQTCALPILNFSAEPWHEYRIPLPEGGTWLEVLNSDSPVYGGSGVGNLGRVHAEQLPLHGREHSVRLSVPPLAALILVPERQIRRATSDSPS